MDGMSEKLWQQGYSQRGRKRMSLETDSTETVVERSCRDDGKKPGAVRKTEIL